MLILKWKMNTFVKHLPIFTLTVSLKRKRLAYFFSIQPPKIMLCRRHLKTKNGESKHFVRPFSYEIYYHTNYIVKLIRNLNKRMHMDTHVYVYKYIFKQRLVTLQKHENSGKNLINTFFGGRI